MLKRLHYESYGDSIHGLPLFARYYEVWRVNDKSERNKITQKISKFQVFNCVAAPTKNYEIILIIFSKL